MASSSRRSSRLGFSDAFFSLSLFYFYFSERYLPVSGGLQTNQADISKGVKIQTQTTFNRKLPKIPDSLLKVHS